MATEQDPTHPTGVLDTTPRGNSVSHRARERKANAALELRKTGTSWADIAEVVGYPTGRHAQVAVEQALENDLKNPESQEFMRSLMGQRLDRLLRGVWKKAIAEKHPEHLLATTKARELIAQQTKLFGLDAPTEMVVHSPSGAELDKWVSEVVKARTPVLEEADIFEGEIVETSESEGEPSAVPTE
jgi:hypothetical protein